jgi:hypothetical protein
VTRRFVLFVVGVAAAGALLSLLREDDGAIFLGAALIAAGIIVFLAGRRARAKRAAEFAGPFTPHVAVELTARRQAMLLHRAIFAIGRNGFTVRTGAPLPLQPGVPQRVDVEFLKPEMALPHFAPGVAFSMVDGPHLVADGEVLTKPCTGASAAA